MTDRTSTRRHVTRHLLPLLAAACLTVACGRGAPAGDGATAPGATSSLATGVVQLSPEEMRAGGVTVEPARTENRTGAFDTPAVLTLDDTRTARIGSIVDGVVVDADVQVGTRVARGTRLATIHSHMVHDAWAGYRRALAERRRAATELAFVTEAEARAARLLATKAVSRQQAERAQADRASAQEGLAIADSEVTRAIEELEHLGIKPDSALTAVPGETVPVDTTVGGVVLERLVTPGTAVTTGTPLFVVSDLSRLWAVAEIDEARLSALAVGRAAELTVGAYPDRRFSGRVTAIGDSVNPDTRRVTARIEIDNRDGALKPQMYANVRVPTGDAVAVVVVPASAVQKIDLQPVVFIETATGRFVRRPVRIGTERDGLVEILDGLTTDDRVASTGTFLLKSRFIEQEQAE